MNIIRKKCDFCKKQETNDFNLALVEKLKESLILSEEYPVLCSNCYKTYKSVKDLEVYLTQNDINCPICKERFNHYEITFDGSGNSAYSSCVVCGFDFNIILHDNRILELKNSNRTLTNYHEILS